MVLFAPPAPPTAQIQPTRSRSGLILDVALAFGAHEPLSPTFPLRGRGQVSAGRVRGMINGVTMFALTVLDYDDAIAFYVGVLGFELLEDADLGGGKRWVRVRPRGSGVTGAAILLARAVTQEQRASVGNQTGGRVFLFFETDDCRRDWRELSAKGVRFVREPSDEPYGVVAVFEDVYGNKCDLIERRTVGPARG